MKAVTNYVPAAAIALLLGLSEATLAAVPPNLPFVSPEVHPDRMVTFRLLAPRASEVSLAGGWMAPNQTKAMTKGDNGIWSVTIGPLKPTVYAYWLMVDGGIVLDPANLYVRLRTNGSSVNMVDVAGGGPLEWTLRDVPHGTVEMNWVKSQIFDGETRETWVYVPPGYEKSSSQRYPVLFLFHGAGELYRAWTESGKANLIFDNLLAENKIKPMIVVMPYTGPAANAPAPAPAPAGGPGAGPGGGRGGNGLAQTRSVDYVLKEVMPWAEAKYRILAGRKNRAVAGFSAGGALAGSIGFGHLELFGQIGMFSAPGQNLETRYADLAKDPKGTSAKLDLFWLGVGTEDPQATAGLRKFNEDLTKLGIRHTYLETEGAHDYSVWRWCLVQFAPLLFRTQ